jgi:hypothetical protein
MKWGRKALAVYGLGDCHENEAIEPTSTITLIGPRTPSVDIVIRLA